MRIYRNKNDASKRLFLAFYLLDSVGRSSILVFLGCYESTYCSASEILKFLNSSEILATGSSSINSILLLKMIIYLLKYFMRHKPIPCSSQGANFQI